VKKGIPVDNEETKGKTTRKPKGQFDQKGEKAGKGNSHWGKTLTRTKRKAREKITRKRAGVFRNGQGEGKKKKGGVKKQWKSSMCDKGHEDLLKNIIHVVRAQGRKKKQQWGVVDPKNGGRKGKIKGTDIISKLNGGERKNSKRKKERVGERQKKRSDPDLEMCTRKNRRKKKGGGLRKKKEVSKKNLLRVNGEN